MKRWLAAVAGALLLGTASPVPVVAQSREDSATVWLDAARQLRESGQPGAADALLELLQRRFAGTTAAADAARLLAVARAQPEPERPGRVELLLFSTVYGAWLGVALPVIGKADQPEIYGLGMLAGAPLGFLAGRDYLRKHSLTEGQARAITFGGTWGSWQGFGWTEVLDAGRDRYCDGFSCYEDTTASGEALVAGTVLGGLAGIATGAVLARKPITSGVATTVSFGGFWGTGYGFVLGVILRLEDDDLLAASLIGGDAGVLAMGLIAPRWNPSRSQARLVSLGGVVGLLGGLGLDLIIQPDETTAAVIPAAASAAGMLIAANSLQPQAAPADDPARPDGSSDPGGPLARESGALVDYRSGKWQLAVPAVQPMVERSARLGKRASLYVPVLQARF